MPKELPDKLPPQNIDAEKSLLGCLMLNKDAITKVADFIQPTDFYRKSHQEIYKVCQELFGKGEAIDVLSVANRLKEVGKLEEIAKNGYVLTPGRYVGVSEEKDDGIPFEEKMKKTNLGIKRVF